MGKASIIVIGGGAAGLSAAHELSEAGVEVQVLEARQPLGGRILSVGSRGAPVEVGAEFVHGKSPHLWAIIKSAQLSTEKVSDRHRLYRDSKLTELPDFWDGLGKIMEKIDSILS